MEAAVSLPPLKDALQKVQLLLPVARKLPGTASRLGLPKRWAHWRVPAPGPPTPGGAEGRGQSQDSPGRPAGSRRPASCSARSGAAGPARQRHLQDPDWAAEVTSPPSTNHVRREEQHLRLPRGGGRRHPEPIVLVWRLLQGTWGAPRLTAAASDYLEAHTDPQSGRSGSGRGGMGPEALLGAQGRLSVSRTAPTRPLLLSLRGARAGQEGPVFLPQGPAWAGSVAGAVIPDLPSALR